MIFSVVATAARVLVFAGMLALSLTVFGATAAWAAEIRTNVAIYLSLREILFFSAETGAWTAVRLDPGERVLQPRRGRERRGRGDLAPGDRLQRPL